MSALNLMEILLNGEGQPAAMQAGQQVGLNSNQTQMAMAALLPVLSGALKRNASSPEGLQNLLGAVQRGQHERYLNNPKMMGQQSTVQDGNAILGHLLGSKDMSRAVAARASEQTGIGTDVLKKLLPLAATMVMGSLGKQSRQPGMQDMLMQLAMNQMTGGQAAAPQRRGGGLGGLIGGILGGGRQPRSSGMRAPQAPQAGTQNSGAMGMLNRMLDADGDGSAMDDLFEQFMKR